MEHKNHKKRLFAVLQKARSQKKVPETFVSGTQPIFVLTSICTKDHESHTFHFFVEVVRRCYLWKI